MFTLREWELDLCCISRNVFIMQIEFPECSFDLYTKKVFQAFGVHVADSVMSELTSEARQCLSSHSGRDGIAPWTGVNYW